MNISVILSGGIGERFGREVPKQYSMLCGKEIIWYVVDAIKKSSLNDMLLIVAAENDISRLTTAYGECAVSGDTHNASVKSGLDYIKNNYPQCKNVMFVDAARPFIDTKTIDDYFSLLDEYEAVITTRVITDSLGREGVAYVDRAPYFLIQKPEAFHFSTLYESFTPDSLKTAIVQQMPGNSKIYKNYITDQNLKITYPNDLYFAEYMMSKRMKELN